MKTKLKKILAAVLTVSLLTGVSVSVSSFAAESDMYGNAEDYVERVEVLDNSSGATLFFRDGKTRLKVIVKNSKVAGKNGINGCEQEELITYSIIDNGDRFSIYVISACSSIVYVPETFFGKPVVVDSEFESATSGMLCVPERLKESFKEAIFQLNMKERDYCLETGEVPDLFMSNVDVISYDELNKLFAEHLFD